MTCFDAASESDRAIERACAGFLAQVRPVVSVEGLVVVLLDHERATSRVVFTWEALGQRETSAGARNSAKPPVALGSSMRITLSGSEGALGAVLLRGWPTAGVWPGENRLFQQSARHLAMYIENIQLQCRLDRSASERLAFDRIGQRAGSNAPVDQIYGLFAEEIKKLVDYQRLTIYLASLDADLLTCAYRVGQGVKRGRLEMPRALHGTGCQSVVSSVRGQIVNDLQECAENDWPELSGSSALRAAIIVPVVHGGEAIGAVVLENRLPYAYGPCDEDLLRRAAMLLGPPAANSNHDRWLTGRAGRRAAANEIARVLASSEHLDEVFEAFVLAANKLVRFDRVTLAWLNASGSDIQALKASTGSGEHDDASGHCDLTGIHTRIEYGHEGVGYLSLWRQLGGAFTGQDTAVLDWLGVQISSALQYHSLYRHAWHIGQHQRVQLSAASGQNSEAVAQVTNGRTGDLSHRLGGDWHGPLDPDQRGPDVFGKELLVDAAHALRSPLSSIKGYSSTLLQPDVTWSPEEYQEFLKTIDHEADELNRAIDNLLEATHEEAGAFQLNLVRATAESLLQAAETALAGESWLGPVRFECEQNLPPVQVDPARLVQAIGYLTRCAGRTVTPGATLQVSASLDDGRLWVSIGSADGGTAVVTPPPASISDGSGRGGSPLSWVSTDLMLKVCRTLLQAHGISLQMGSLELPGELFRFHLPVAAVALK